MSDLVIAAGFLLGCCWLGLTLARLIIRIDERRAAKRRNHAHPDRYPRRWR